LIKGYLLPYLLTYDCERHGGNDVLRRLSVCLSVVRSAEMYGQLQAAVRAKHRHQHRQRQMAQIRSVSRVTLTLIIRL